MCNRVADDAQAGVVRQPVKPVNGIEREHVLQLLLDRFGGTILGNGGHDAGLGNLDDGVRGDFQFHGVLLNLAYDAVDAACRDHFITSLEAVLAFLELLLLLALWADEQEVEDDTDIPKVMSMLMGSPS